MARTALAIQRYRLATGRLPASLEELVPRYIKDVPIDPFDGRPSREGLLVRQLRDRFPWIEVRNLTPTLDAARLTGAGEKITIPGDGAIVLRLK